MRLLIVDDSNMIRTRIARVVQGGALTGISIVGLAHNGVEAVRIAQAARPDVVTMDLTMPRMDGRACFTRLHEIDPKVRVVISSGYSAQEVDKRFGAGRLAGFVQKPFKMAGLLGAVRRALEP